MPDLRCYAVVPTFSRPEVAAQCVRALLDQTTPLAGVILVENAPEPHFDGVFDGERVEVVRPGRNLGSAGGYAFGTQVALERGATHVMLVDDDCMLNLDVLARLSAQLEVTPGAVVGPITTTDGTNLTWAGGRQAQVRSRTTVADLPSEAYSSRGFAFHGIMIPADAIRRLGGPRADFFLGAEDVEFCRRLRAGGLEFWACPQARAQHHAPPYRRFWLIGRRQVPVGTPGHRYYVLRNRIVIWRLYRSDSAWTLLHTLGREVVGALTGGRPLKRLALLTRAVRDGALGDPARELRTDIPVFG